MKGLGLVTLVFGLSHFSGLYSIAKLDTQARLRMANETQCIIRISQYVTQCNNCLPIITLNFQKTSSGTFKIQRSLFPPLHRWTIRVTRHCFSYSQRVIGLLKLVYAALEMLNDKSTIPYFIMYTYYSAAQG